MTLDPYLHNRRQNYKKEKEADKKSAGPAVPAKSASDYYYERGGELFEAERWQEAILAYDECLKHELLNSERWLNAMFNRGLAKASMGDNDDALEDLSVVFLRQRSKPDVRYVIGKILALREPITAEYWYITALALDPNYSQAQIALKELERQIRESAGRVPKTENPDGSVYVGKTELVEGQLKSIAYYLPKESLSHVIGLESVKEELWNSIVLPMRRPDLFTKYGLNRSSECLLYGPPGCGKTLLARAVAGETGSYVVVARLHELIDMYSGNTEKNMHAIFKQARELVLTTSKACIVFLDELDAIGMKRELAAKESVAVRAGVNQLLVELDGIEKNPEGMYVMAATNRPWDIDVALKRSGRFGKCVYIPPPLREDRKKIFEYYVGCRPAATMDFDRLASVTEGYSSADIECVVNTAMLRPLLREFRTGVESVLKMSDLLAALEDPTLGKGTLREWYFSVADELFSQPLDAARYKPMLDDIMRALHMNSVEKPHGYAV